MKLYRIVHKNYAYSLNSNPGWGCGFHERMPLIVASGTLGEAILAYQELSGFRFIFDSYLAVEYLTPKVKVHKFTCDFSDTYGSSTFFGEWATEFLSSKKYLLSAFPSRNWLNIRSFLINPRHSLFPEVKISNINPIARQIYPQRKD